MKVLFKTTDIYDMCYMFFHFKSADKDTIRNIYCVNIVLERIRAIKKAPQFLKERFVHTVHIRMELQTLPSVILLTGGEIQNGRSIRWLKCAPWMFPVLCVVRNHIASLAQIIITNCNHYNTLDKCEALTHMLK